MKKSKIIDKKTGLQNDKRRKLLIAAGLASLIFTTRAVKMIKENQNDKYISSNYSMTEITSVDDNFTRILWLNYMYYKNYNEEVCLVIDECLNNLTDENIARVNSLLTIDEQYENTIFSDIVTINNYNGYYVNYTNIVNKNVIEGKSIDIDYSKSINAAGSTYIDIDELLTILYDGFKGELRSIN